ncbi:hypothetical protein L1O03_11125 [Corynebacterium uropygiale]|uniref:Uncharacterized protein n=1 Tax=Corynebacterium uropygiale TaxID=1775911 RepID=A0A9X1TYV2_9CORY|nr:hypothetical protein [Corynebacterium uropygiale]MCF4007715.1 hypothetical protein [Corynebacterium uropygiale]
MTTSGNDHPGSHAIAYLRSRGCTSGAADEEKFGDCHLIHSRYKGTWIGARGPIGILFSTLDGGEIISGEALSITRSRLHDCDLHAGRGLLIHHAQLNGSVSSGPGLIFSITDGDLNATAIHADEPTHPEHHPATFSLSEQSRIDSHQVSLGTGAVCLLRGRSHIEGLGELSIDAHAGLLLDGFRSSTGLGGLRIPEQHLVALHSDGLDAHLEDMYVVATIPLAEADRRGFITSVAVRLHGCGGWAISYPLLDGPHTALHTTLWRGGDERPSWVRTLEAMVASGEAAPLTESESWAGRTLIPDVEPGIFSGDSADAATVDCLRAMTSVEELHRYWEDTDGAQEDEC